jgi:hypothetical protein
VRTAITKIDDFQNQNGASERCNWPALSRQADAFDIEAGAKRRLPTNTKLRRSAATFRGSAGLVKHCFKAEQCLTVADVGLSARKSTKPA